MSKIAVRAEPIVFVVAFWLGALSSATARPNFVVDELTLGQAVDPESQIYQSYACRASVDFSGFTWCDYHREKSGKFGPYKSSVMFLHSPSRRVTFITESIVPAVFAPGDVDHEINRISSWFNQPAKTITDDARPGVAHAILATWGEVTLTPLDEAALNALRHGDQIHRGLIADLIGNARESARLGLPVFSIGGGPGFLWGASFDSAGRGSLRSSAVDVSQLGASEAPAGISAQQMLPLRHPVLSEDAPRLEINNNSCRDIDTVLIDGATQLHGITPGNVGVFHMDGRCKHAIEGISGEVTWTESIRCQGAPYYHYTLNWILASQPGVASSAPDDSLIVERRSNDNYGTVNILDCITVQKVTANRGNCQVGIAEPNKVLKFGQTLEVPYFCGKLLELNLGTDQGSSTFTFDR